MTMSYRDVRHRIMHDRLAKPSHTSIGLSYRSDHRGVLGCLRYNEFDALAAAGGM
ncbi:hypothetical protein PROPHIGD91-4_9 [Mycobacterium phage prophi91-4]|nr:hypothetical protein PROPHIGD91-4_9 [Mycobacterium phage prophi91-4]